MSMYALLFINGDSDNVQVFLVNIMNSGVDLGGIPLSRAPQISRRNTRFTGAVIRPDYQFLPRFGDLILGLASLY